MIVIGGGGHAKVIISLLQRLNKYRIVGYTDINDKGAILGIPYLGDDSILQKLKKENKINFVALGIGYVESTLKRDETIKRILKLGFVFPSIVSKDSVVANDVIIDEGTVVMNGAVINSGTRIGSFSIINTKASVDHDCKIGDSVHVSPGATICGNVTVGNQSNIGAGAVIIQNKFIASQCIIGAGSVVIENCVECGTYIGVPARKKK